MTNANYIPGDIMADVLSRLPAISLLRFKTVCKSWYFLISNPGFINLQSKRISQHPKILFATDAAQFRLLDFESSLFDDSCLSHPLGFPRETPYYKDSFVRILGSSCGLVCVVHGHPSANPFLGVETTSLYLWNPSTTEFRKLPDLSPSIIRWHTLRVRCHGLGYDPVSNDLKLVVSDETFATTFNVFSMKSNSWKLIMCPRNLDSNRSTSIKDSQATVLNGVFHWLNEIQRPYPNFSTFEIIAFDSKEDKRLNVQLPAISPSSLYNARLLKHKDCLCISFRRIGVAEYGEIWMLKGHDWIHFLNVYPRFIPQLERCFWPICISKSSTQITFRDKKQHLVRLTKEDPVKLDKIHTDTAFEATIYIETLVSPNHIHIID